MDRRFLLLPVGALLALIVWVLWPVEDPATPPVTVPADKAELGTELPALATTDIGPGERNEVEIPAASAEEAVGPGFNLGDLIQVVGQSQRTLRGRVVHDGVGVSGAKVLLYQGLGFSKRVPEAPPLAQAVSDAAGGFELLGPAEHTQLVATAEGFGPIDYLTLDLPGSGVVEGLVLEVFPLQEVRGVVTAAGQPQPDTKISIDLARRWERSRSAQVSGTGYRALAAHELVTDDAGVFSKRIPSGRYIVNAKHETRGEAFKSFTTPSVDLLLELEVEVVDPGSRIQGRVLFPDGRGAAAAQVIFATDGPRTPCDSDGGFTLAGVEKHWALQPEVLAWAPGYAPGWATLDELPAEGMTGVEVVLQEALPVEGVLLDAQDQPITNAWVYVSGEREYADGTSPPNTVLSLFVDPDSGQDLRQVRTDTEGRFRFPHLGAGQYLIDWRGPGSSTRWLDPRANVQVVAGESGVVLRDGEFRAPQVVFVGRVVDRYSGQPVVGAKITANHVRRQANGGGWSASGVATAEVQEDGSYRLAGLTEGEYYLSFAKDGYADSKSEPTEFEVGEHHQDFQVVEERSLFLTVIGADGEPVSGANVWVHDEDGTEMMIQLGGGGARSPGTTDDHGELIMHGMPAARITVEISVEYFQPRTEVQFDLRLPGAHREEVQVEGVSLDASVSAILHLNLDPSGGASIPDADAPLVATAFNLDGFMVSREEMWFEDGVWKRRKGQVVLDSKDPRMILNLAAEGGSIEVRAPGYQLGTLSIPATSAGGDPRDFILDLRPAR